MTWDQQPIDATLAPPAPTDPATPTETRGFRRAVLTAGMAAALLVTGGTAVVLAASPDPSAAPSSGATTTPQQGGQQRHTGQPCPNDDSDSTPSTTTPT